MRAATTNESTPPPADAALSTKQPRKKKYHRRSRTGCLTCRKRRVKCDEGQPACIKCLVLGLSCHYDTTPQTPGAPAAGPNQHTFSLGPSRVLQAPSTVLPVDMIFASPRVLHHFMQCRDRVRATVPIGPHAEPYIGLPTFMENPAGFRMALVISIAHMRTLEGSTPEMERTSIIHKLGLLDTIKQAIAASAVHVLDFIHTAIVLLFHIEHAAGDKDAAEAHLRGISNLEATHPYTQAQQLRARIALCLFSLLSRGTVNQAGHHNDAGTGTRGPDPACYRHAAFIYIHILHEYLVEPSCGELARAHGKDKRLLRWLLDYVRGRRDGTAGASHKADCFAIMTAVSAYALTVGSLRTLDTKAEADPVSVATGSRPKSAAGSEPQPAVKDNATGKTSLDLTKTQSPRRIAKPPTRQRDAKRPVKAENPALLELSHWVDDLMRDWRRSPRMVEWDNSGQFADKVEWLGTEKGLTLLEIICRESEDDVGARGVELK